MNLLILIKIIHILSVIFFMGVVGFRTFILPVLKEKLDKDLALKIMPIIGKRARSIIKINNIFLILSGLFLFLSYSNEFNLLLHIKAMLGLILAFTFYLAPFILKKFNHIPWFNKVFHHKFFFLMIVVVILSQIMFIY